MTAQAKIMLLLRKGIILTIFLLFTGIPAAQVDGKFSTSDRRAIKEYQKALASFRQRDYSNADRFLDKALEQDSSFVEAWLMRGDLFLEKGDKEQAIKDYSKAVEISPDVFPPALVVLARMLRNEGRYEEALPFYEDYLRKGQVRKLMVEAKEGRASCVFAIDAMENPVPFDPSNLGEGVNTEHDEFVNALSTDEEHLYYTVKLPTGTLRQDGTERLGEDFYIIDNEDGTWINRREMGGFINTRGNEGALMISADGRYAFFAGCDRPGGYGSCDIYYCKSSGEFWEEPRNLKPPVNSRSWDSHPSFATDGRTLYFASNRGGGLGSSDIYVSRIGDDGKWTKPVNLGDSVNTRGQEMSPLIHPDGKTLYFASSGHAGMGGLDIFISRMNPDGSWGKARNLGYPINTHADELALIVNARGDRAYFSSDKLGGQGKYDIYAFPLYPEARPLPVTYMKGFVLDEVTSEPVHARFELIDLESGEIVVEAWSDQSTGDFLVSIPSDAEYALNVSAEGYLFHSEHFYLPESYEKLEPYRKDVRMKRILEGESVVMRNVFFETDKYNLLPRSRTELDHLAKLLEKNPGISIEVAGHTDNVGSAEYNQELSEQRARTVYEYLVEKGISEDRLTYKGYGLERPVADNDTEEGRAQNRRTEFTVTEVVDF